MSDQNYTAKNIALIILAAGKSSRLGSPKQLLKYQGKNLLQHSIDVALGSNAAPVLLVLGSESDEIKKQLNKDRIILIENPDWESGMASSIKYGINKILTGFPEKEAVIIMVCDQPYVSSDLLNKLISAYQASGKNIIASRYDQILGTPALFHKTMFAELTALEGDRGAKILFNKFSDEIALVDFKDGGIDIDTSEDYKNLAK